MVRFYSFCAIFSVVANMGCLTWLYSQCMTYPVSLEERVNGSGTIVLAKPIKSYPYKYQERNLIFTMHEMEVIAWFKNYRSDTKVYVITKGGVLENEAVMAHPSLQIDPHNEYLLFLIQETEFFDKELLDRSPNLAQYSPFTDAQGALVYQDGLYRDLHVEPPRDERATIERIKNITGTDPLRPDGSLFESRPYIPPGQSRSVTSFSPNPTPAGTVLVSDFLTITGTNFGNSAGTVQYRNADDGGNTWISSGVQSDNVSWNNTQIVNKVAQSAGTGQIRVVTSNNNTFTSSTTLTIPYAHLCVNSSFFNWPENTRNRIRLVNKNGQGGYTMKYSTSFNGNQSRVESFERALESWQCNTEFNAIVDGTTTINTNANDGTFAVYWSNLGGGTLGICWSYFAATGNSNCQQSNTVWYLNEFDIGFNSSTNWEYGPAAPTGGKFDFESVALHELGHAHGLGHVINASAVMHFAIGPNTSKRVLSTGEINGGLAKMAYSVQPLCVIPSGVSGPMIEYDCALPVRLIRFDATRINAQTAKLDWSLAYSSQNKGFDIRRSYDGRHFEHIDFISVQSDLEKNFSYLDFKAGNHGVYYQLIQQDKDGKTENLGIRYVPGEYNQSYHIFSHASQSLTIQAFDSAPDEALLNLYSPTGTLIHQTKIFSGQVTELNISMPYPFILAEITTKERIFKSKVVLRL